MEHVSQAAADNAAAPSERTPEELMNELAAAQAQAQESRQKHLYAMAELENVRKRMEKQLADRLVAGRKELLAKFLPVIDNLHRALGFEIASESLRDGLQATLRGFEAALASEQVRPVQVLGMPFDPRVAEAIGTRLSNEVPDNTVLDEAQRGYLIGEELLRPAQVIVSQYKAEESP